MSDAKFDLFDSIRKIDKQDRSWYDNQPLHHQKQISCFLMMQWLACGDNDAQIVLLNEYVNKFIFPLYKHPKLLAKLLTICTSGTPQRYKWIAQTKNVNVKRCLDIIGKAYDTSSKESRLILDVIDRDNILIMAHDFGLQPDEIKLIQKELNSLNG